MASSTAFAPTNIEEFNDVVKRHGAWNQNVRDFVEQVAQLSLFAEVGR